MLKFWYKQSPADHTLFIRHLNGKVTALIVYVDDIILTGNETQERFWDKRVGNPIYFLGIEVARSERGLFTKENMF